MGHFCNSEGDEENNNAHHKTEKTWICSHSGQNISQFFLNLSEEGHY